MSRDALPSPLAGIQPGDRHAARYRITEEVSEGFLRAFRDYNRIHVDDAYARDRGFAARVAHGAILNGFISHFVGECFPGGDCLLHSVSIQYKSPSHPGDEIELEAVVTQTVEAVGAILLDVVLTNQTRGRVAARAKVQVGTL